MVLPGPRAALWTTRGRWLGIPTEPALGAVVLNGRTVGAFLIAVLVHHDLELGVAVLEERAALDAAAGELTRKDV